MESVTMNVVSEENQEECLGIQDQASGEVQVSMKAEGLIILHIMRKLNSIIFLSLPKIFKGF